MNLNFLIILKIYLTLAFLLFVTPAFSQDQFRIQNGVEIDDSKLQPFMRLFHTKIDFVLAFRTFFPMESASESKYFVLTGRGKQLKAYSYSKNILHELNLSGNSLNQIWRTFEQNDLLKLRNEIDIPNFCAKKYEIFESYTYEFTLVAGGRMKVLSYYSPEYYIEACYGMSERQNIINAVAIINQMAPEY